MRTLTVVCNVASFLFTLFVLATDGAPKHPAYIIFTLLLVLIPVFTVLALVRSRAEQPETRVPSSGTSSMARAAAICNVVLLGVICWILMTQSHPAEPGFIEYATLIVFTPVLSAVVLFLAARSHGRPGPQTGWPGASVTEGDQSGFTFDPSTREADPDQTLNRPRARARPRACRTGPEEIGTRQLWRDIRAHRVSAGVFLAYWAATWAITALTWQAGMGQVAVILHLLSPVIAGGLVGWWRAPVREGLLVGRGYLAGGPLAAALVILIDIAFIFGAAGVYALHRGTWQWAGVVAWLAFSAAFGLIALLFGLVGALAGRTLARLAGARASH